MCLDGTTAAQIEMMTLTQTEFKVKRTSAGLRMEMMSWSLQIYMLLRIWTIESFAELVQGVPENIRISLELVLIIHVFCLKMTPLQHVKLNFIGGLFSRFIFPIFSLFVGHLVFLQVSTAWCFQLRHNCHTVWLLLTFLGRSELVLYMNSMSQWDKYQHGVTPSPAHTSLVVTKHKYLLAFLCFLLLADN